MFALLLQCRESVTSSGGGIALMVFFSCQEKQRCSEFFIGGKLRTSIVMMPHKNKYAPLKNHADR